MLQCKGSLVIVLFYISLQAVMLHMGHIHHHIHFKLNKVLQDLNKS